MRVYQYSSLVDEIDYSKEDAKINYKEFRMKSVAEPTGALALAVALSEEFNEKYPASVYKNIGVILCGGNLDLSVVPKMLELANQ